MKHHVIPLLRKEPSFVIIHVGTNDAPYLTSRKILDNLLTLKSFMTYNLSNCKVISTPTLRTDDGKAALTLSQLTNHLLQLDVDIIGNRNINTRNLGNKGLHLNPTGTKWSCKNLLSSKKFLKSKYPGITSGDNIEPEHPSVFDSAMPTSINNSEDKPENRILKEGPDQYQTEKPKPS